MRILEGANRTLGEPNRTFRLGSSSRSRGGGRRAGLIGRAGARFRGSVIGCRGDGLLMKRVLGTAATAILGGAITDASVSFKGRKG